MDWRNHFQSHILERGLNYYLQRRVKSFEETSNKISATVSGSDDYLVEAHFEANQLVTLSCDCPHATGGNFCKHMAAVMYVYENKHEHSSDSQMKGSVEDYIKNADENVVRSFLTKILINDSNLFKQFVTSLGDPITKLDMDRYGNEIRHIFEAYLYPDGFIYYNETWDFSSDLSHYMNKIIKKLLLENNYYEEAFKLTNQVFVDLVDLPIDDSNGTIIDIATDCSELWEMILDQCDIKLKRKMFAWFIDKLENESFDYLKEFIEEILWSKFQEDEFLDQKRVYSKRKLDESKDSTFFPKKYDAEKWAYYYLKALNQMEEIIEFCESNLEYLAVREFYVDKLIESKEFQKAISLLEELKNPDKRLTYESREKLMELYAETNDKKAFIEELSYLVIYHGSSRIDLYKRYKSQFSEEKWLKIREPLIKEISLWNGKDELLMEEEMYDELLEVAIKKSGLEVVRKYKKLLYELDPIKVFDKYEMEILEASKETSNRKTYRAIAYTIGELKQLSNHNPRVDEIVSYLRQTYKRRPAMMEELSGI